ncbi:MAG: DUF4982 domain-containing protein [Mangrovibacterium sp.]
MRRSFYMLLALLLNSLLLEAQRSEFLLEKNWKFSKGDFSEAMQPGFDDSGWENVRVPHDWAIYGPFDRSCDLQEVAVTQNLENRATVKTGRTGGLPYTGTGWYRTRFDVPAGRQVSLLFEGAMSEARVYVNGQEACYWPYGYNAFHVDITALLKDDGKENVLAVRLENRPQSSRWYPGAGLYRDVQVIVTGPVHVPVWGTCVTTPVVSDSLAAVRLETQIEGGWNRDVRVVTDIFGPDGQLVAREDQKRRMNPGQPFVQNFVVEQPRLWSPESPVLYRAVSTIYMGEQEVDRYLTRFGIRGIALIPDKGFYLNGQRRKFQGVNLHHDLGPLGAAVSEAAIRHQLSLLKDMGCDAIRTAHNMPAPALVRLCDEMGFMLMVEPFDEWNLAKCKNGYHRFFDQWAERDMENMLRHFRNNASVLMWSIGNEVPAQCSTEGYRVASFLQDICHREDPTRPVTCGMDRVSCVLGNGFAALLDIPGFNYRVHRYEEAYAQLPQRLVLGTETASTVSSRGVYKFPAEIKAGALYEDHQSSSYDLEHCSWSNVPDDDLAMAEDHDWDIGQFVWTGFDYLGEPSPYDTDAWPSHSSLFGIIDLACLPKDRFYLYRSLWNRNKPTLHVLPHWNWKGREGRLTPIFVYTSYPSAELFVNGKSYGHRKKSDESRQHRYRLMWMEVPYQPGELKVVAYDRNGNQAAEKVIRTAGKPYRLDLKANRKSLQADGKDLVYVTASVVDKDGNLCPDDARLVSFKVSGAGWYRAGANGDPTCLDLFHLPRMHAFSGRLTAIVQAREQSGEIVLEATAKGLKAGTIVLQVE